MERPEFRHQCKLAVPDGRHQADGPRVIALILVAEADADQIIPTAIEIRRLTVNGKTVGQGIRALTGSTTRFVIGKMVRIGKKNRRLAVLRP